MKPLPLIVLSIMLSLSQHPASAQTTQPTPDQLAAANQAVLDADEGGVMYPVAAGVANVRAYGAVGDGVTDDTAAIQAALDARPKNQIIYFPHGTYLISDTLRWTGEDNRQKRQIFQGQSQDGVVLRLPDHAEGFGDPDNPRAMIWTGRAPAQRFANSLRDLTFDVGAGNPGAIGARYMANNLGGIFRVTFRSSDPDHAGHIGLDMGYTNEQGPCLIWHVTVDGFGTGIYTNHGVNSVTLEHITLRNQQRIGFDNNGQCISMRGLTTEGLAGPAFRNTAHGVLALIDSELSGGGEVALINAERASMMLRNVSSPGYDRLLDNTNGHGRGVSGTQVDEFVTHPVLTLFGDPEEARTLGLPVEEVPEVPWDHPDDWANVADFGPPERIELVHQETGRTDVRDNWTAAIQRAIDSGARTVYFPVRHDGGAMGYYGDIHVRGNVQRITGLRHNFPSIVDSTRHLNRYQPEAMPRFIIEDGAGPVVFEDFDNNYHSPVFLQRSGRPLIVQQMAAGTIRTEPGAAPTFIVDVVVPRVEANGSRIIARQLNTEGWEEPRNQASGGGSLWVLGLKTEGDRTIAHARGGGQIEIVGGFFYANKASDPDKVMFRIDEGGALSVTGGEMVIRNQPFTPAVQTRGGETRTLGRGGDVPGRGGGSMIPLFVARPAEVPAD
jgi:hypothetical protein